MLRYHFGDDSLFADAVDKLDVPDDIHIILMRASYFASHAHLNLMKVLRTSRSRPVSARSTYGDAHDKHRCLELRRKRESLYHDGDERK